jgi:hypothetical protein
MLYVFVFECSMSIMLCSEWFCMPLFTTNRDLWYAIIHNKQRHMGAPWTCYLSPQIIVNNFLDGINNVCVGLLIAKFRDICSCTYVQRFAQYEVCILFIIGMCNDLHSMKFSFSTSRMNRRNHVFQTVDTTSRTDMSLA